MTIIHPLIVVRVYIKFTYYFIKSCYFSITLLASSVHLQERDLNIRNTGIPGPADAPPLVSVSDHFRGFWPDNQLSDHTEEFSQSGDAGA
ncbi:hypothetical protein AVEN_34921-1, partial [Araneus ventricosus]